MFFVFRWTVSGCAAVLLALVATRMSRTGLYRQYPAFFVYAVWDVVRFLASFIFDTFGAYHAFFYFYYVGRVIGCIFFFLIAENLYRRFFAPFEGLQKLGRLLFRWTAFVMVAITAVAVFTSTSRLETPWAALNNMDQAVTTVVAGVTFFLFVFAAYFGVEWDHYSLGIAVGIALSTSVAMTDRWVLSIFGSSAGPITSSIHTAGSACAVVVWARYMLTRPRLVSPPLRSPAHNLDKWNATLQELLAR